MPEPKKQKTKRGTGLRRSHIRLNLAKRVNKTSSVKVFTTKKQSSKSLDESTKKPAKAVKKSKSASNKAAKKKN